MCLETILNDLNLLIKSLIVENSIKLLIEDDSKAGKPKKSVIVYLSGDDIIQLIN